MNNENEKELLDLVTKWTEHFRCRKDFDEWRKRRIWQENYQETEIKELERLSGGLKNKRILDVGCGMGGLLIAMNLSGLDAAGLDPNEDYCKITKMRGQRYKINPEVYNAYGEKIPFKNDCFDVIISKDVLEHCKNPKRFLKEGYRVLKPGGKFFINVCNRFGYSDSHYHLRFVNWMPDKIRAFITEKISKKRIDLFKDKQRLCDMHYFTAKSFKKMAKEIGFKKCVNLAIEGRNRPFFAKMPIIKVIFANFFLAAWDFILTKNDE